MIVSPAKQIPTFTRTVSLTGNPLGKRPELIFGDKRSQSFLKISTFVIVLLFDTVLYVAVDQTRAITNLPCLCRLLKSDKKNKTVSSK